jgi:predicted AlkP superfamily pyrophosphatase or phosphodiesterase
VPTNSRSLRSAGQRRDLPDDLQAAPRAAPGAAIGIFHDWDGFGHLFEQERDHDAGRRRPASCGGRSPRRLVPRRKKPDLTFIHLDDVDHAGHNHGWLSPQYDAAIREADRLIGEVEPACEKAGMAESDRPPRHGRPRRQGRRSTAA